MVPGHCQSNNGTPESAGHSEHRTQLLVGHLRGGSEAILGLLETLPCIARTPSNRPRTAGH
eukprot:14110587-Alexandrium_andersonii.AAC.1